MPIFRRSRIRATRHDLATACRAAIEHLEVRTLLTATIYVDATAPGNGGGSSWQNAAHDLQVALAAAQSGDEIRVADGTYEPTTGTDRSATFTLKNGVRLLGGYAGYGAPNPDARDVPQYPTILSGDIGTSGDATDNSYHVVTGSGVDASALLDGFTITAGNANGGAAGGQVGGGGMYNIAGSPTVNNCTFIDNSSLDFSPSGGAMYNQGSSPTLTNCTFSENSAYAGAAIYNANASAPKISHCTFSANSTASGGGAIHNASSSPVLTDCTFTGNVTTSGGLAAGGAMYNDSSNPTLTRCTFTANRAYVPRFDGLESAYGGAIYNHSSSPSLNLCTFDRNNASSATSGGGAIYNDTSSPSVVNCLFTRNSAGDGGAIENDRASAPTFTNCAFAANNAAGEYRGTGGAIFNTASAKASLINCTVAGNAALTGTGGIVSSSGASVTLTNCIVWDNTTPPAQTDQVIGPFTATYTDLPGGAAGAGNLDTKPLFLRNPTPGPDGRWGTDDDDPGDLRLSPTSPVADAGNNLALPSGLTTDLAGAPRFTDIPTTADRGAGAAPIVDPGAYEAMPALAANAGGPYALLQGHQIQLDAHGSSNVPGALQFAWDFNGDGAYDDATGPTPTFDTSTRSPSQFNVSVRVTDASGSSVTDTTTLRVAPTIFYVDATASAAHTGSSWADARADLAGVLNLALPGQEIRVAKGTYKPTDGTDRFATFQLTSGVTILGGYAGQTAPNPDARDVAANPTVLSGQIGNQSDDSDNSYHVVTASGADASTVLDGFTITDGNANDRYVDSRGGGLYIRTGSPTLRNCTFTANHAVEAGGMGNADSAAPTLVNCTFVGNTADFNGGAIADFNAAPILTGCTFVRNSAKQGGAVYNDSSAPRIVNCRFDGNSSAPGNGGAVVNYYSPATVIGCAFAGNYARVGGAIYNSSSASVISNCTFAGNSAEIYGGALYTYAPAPTLTNCILWGNSARTGPQVYRADTTMPVIRYSDVQGGWTGTGNINADPLFVRAPAPGPDGRWGTDDDDFGDLRLGAGSPAVDAGDNAAPGLSGITTDLDGNNRYADVPTAPDTGSGDPPLIDLGAFEFQPALSADASGPYAVIAGQRITLSGHGASPAPGTLQYAWDFDADGLFDDATGPNPVFDSSGVPAGSTLAISLRVTDAASHVTTDSTTLRVIPAIVYVDPRATGAGNGTSWNDAVPNLAAALGDAIPGQQLRVAAGTYTPTTAADRYVSFELKNGVSLYGGYAGLSVPANPNLHDPDRYHAILSGDIGIAGDNADNSYHVVVAQSVDATALLDGFWITAGNANAPDGANGGGMYVSAASPTVTHCVFTRNDASSSGGGMYNVSASPQLTDCTFTGNSAGYYGGGMASDSASPTMINCLFSGNLAKYDGGATYSVDSSPTFVNCTLSGNTAKLGGGIFSTITGKTTLTNCIVWGNAAPTDAQISIFGAATSNVTYSDVQGGFFGVHNISVDPRFARSPDPGLDGQWGTSDDDFGDLRPQSGSPAIDSGNSAAVPAGITTDLAGNLRFTDVPAAPDTGAGPAPIVDMGAYEATATPALIGDANDDHAVDFNDLVILAQNYNTTGKTWSQGDFNGDGSVDFNDLVLLAQHYNTSLAAAFVPAAPAPAPSHAPSPAKPKSPMKKPIFSVVPVVSTKSRGDRRPTRYAHR